MGKHYGRIKKILKVAGYIIGAILLIPILILLTLKIPGVQNYALKEITQTFSQKLHTEVRLKKVTIGFPKSVQLEGIYIEGQKKDTLLYAGKLEIGLDFLKLINKEICISELGLENAYGNIYRNSGAGDFNYAFIVNAFSDTSSKTPSAWTFDLKSIRLKQVRLNYKDIPGGTSVLSYLNTFKVNFKSLGMEDQKMVVDEANINGLRLALNFTKPQLTAQATDTSKTSALQTFIEDLTIKNSYFIYNDYIQKAIAKGIDYNRLSLQNINGSFSYIKMKGPDLALAVNELSLKEKSGLDLHELHGNLNMKSSGIRVELKKIETSNSHINHPINVFIPLGKESDMGELAFDGNLKNETIALKDVYYFMPDLDTLRILRDKKILLSGNIKGIMRDFTLSDLKVRIDGQVDMKANVKARGLPELKAAYVDVNLEELYINSDFAAAFLPHKEQRAYLTSLGNIHVNGSLKGYTISPLANLNIHTDAGNLTAKVKMNTDTSFNLKGYSGLISANGIDLGRILSDTSLGKLTARLNAQGFGKDIYSFSANVNSFGYNHYDYHDLQIKGSLLKNVVQGNFTSLDSHLVTDFKIYADLNTSIYKITGEVTKADLYAMNFIKLPFVLKTRVDGVTQGKSIDSLTGFIKLSDTHLANDSRNYKLDSIVAQATLENGLHTFSFNSPLAAGRMDGQFSVAELSGLFSYMQSSYYNSSLPLPDLPHTQSLALSLKAGNVSELVQFFIPEINLLDSININGQFRKKEGLVNLRSSVKRITYDGNQMKGIFLNADGVDKKLKFSSGMESLISGNNNINKALASGMVSRDKVSFNIKLYDQKAPTRLNMEGQMYLHNDTNFLNFPSAQIFIKGKEWNFNKGNKIVYAKNYITIHDLELKQAEQKISVNTRIAGKSGIGEAEFQKVHLSELADLAGLSSYRLSGTLNGKAEITDMLASQGIKGEMRIDSLAMNNEKIGNITFTALKDQGSDRIALNLNLTGGENKAHIYGNYAMGKENNIDLTINVSQLAIHPFEPLTKAFAYHLQGNIAANLRLAGKSNAPVLTGKLRFKERNEIGLTAVHTTYALNDQEIVFNEKSIQFNHFALLDSLNQEAVANGYIYHDHFSNIKFDMTFDTDNFQLVNSGYTPDESFYGKLYAKMNAEVSGLIDNLKIRFNVVTRKGTKLYIPLASQQSGTVMPSYVHINEIEPEQDWSNSKSILDPTKADPQNIKTPKVDLSKFDITGRVRFTKDAELNIIVDPANGDKISAKGNGSFSVDFDSQNNLNLYGTYTIDSGNYNFSFVNLVKKDFKIQKGSYISWAGDPEDATLSINAIYKTRASRYELIQDQTDFMTADQIAAAKRPLPVEVYLNLTGTLLSPVINFDIKVPEGGDPLSGNMVVQKIDQIKNDPNELSKQVFSLIVLNKFMTQSGSTGGGSGGNVALNEANQSVSKLLNKQLNQLSEDYLRGVSLNVNLQSLDQSYGAFAQNATVTATKQISTRISVSAGGNVNINSNYGSGQFAGDYNIYYRVNPSGTVNLKFFRTSLQTIYSNNLYTQQGFSGTYRMEFNRRGDIFRKKSNRRSSSIKKDNLSQN